MSLECPFCGGSIEIDDLSENDGVCSLCDRRLLPADFDYDSTDEEAILAEMITDEDESLDDEYYEEEDLEEDEDLEDEDDERYSGLDDDLDEDSDEERFFED